MRKEEYLRRSFRIDRWPENGSTVAAAGQCEATVGRKSYRSKFFAMADERQKFFTRMGIPQLCRVVLAAG